MRFLASRERHSKAESPAFLGLVAVASAAVATDSGGGDAVLVVPFPLLHSIVGGFLRERSLARSQNRDADPVFVEMSQGLFRCTRFRFGPGMIETIRNITKRFGFIPSRKLLATK